MTTLYAVCIKVSEVAGESIYDWWDFKDGCFIKPNKVCSYLTSDGDSAKIVVNSYKDFNAFLRTYCLIKEQNDGA